MSANRYQLKHPVEAMRVPIQEDYPQDQLSAYIMEVTDIVRWCGGKTVTSATGLCVMFSPVGDTEVLTDHAKPGEWILRYVREADDAVDQVRLTDQQFRQLLEPVGVV